MDYIYIRRSSALTTDEGLARWLDVHQPLPSFNVARTNSGAHSSNPSLADVLSAVERSGSLRGKYTIAAPMRQCGIRLRLRFLKRYGLLRGRALPIAKTRALFPSHS
jgi:hypothetical protein